MSAPSAKEDGAEAAAADDPVDDGASEARGAAGDLDWVREARTLAVQRARPKSGWEVLRGTWPPVLDGDGVRALMAPLVAAVAWLGAGFREIVAGTAIDPLAILMRLLAIGLTTRALLLGIGLVRRLIVAARAKRSALVLSPRGLFFTDGASEASIEREAIVAITESGIWQTRRSGRPWADVFVVGSSRDALFLRIPPLFEHSAGVLAERLMRWLGAQPYDESRVFPEPAQLASKVYDDAAQGITAPGTLVLPHGLGWARSGPYATILLAIVMIEGLARLEVPIPPEVLPFAIGAIVVALVFPLGWWWTTRREISVRKGIALVLTPAELLLRTRAGVHRARWGRLQRVSIDTRRAFSVLDGVHEAKALVLKRKDEPPIRYDEAFLGLPVEVAQALLDAYRTGLLPRQASALSPSPADVSPERLDA
jgi:hypothetical protein